ncbi:MLP-like protein 31 [Gossypium australe]|uniref:MLP-like protein 31 n=1 Tax=Gossypium australe TaxID=47621 RepID=A0A5B6WPD8_9ROSI|nr:MLP-like protein 31 [Gossypium australe]
MAQIRRMDCKVEVKSSADRFFDAFNTKAHLMPKMSTRLISDVKLLQGDWNSLGSVRMWYYASQGKSAACKEVRENVDEKNRTIVYSLLEGEISNYYKTWKSTLNVTPNGEGSLAKWTIEYEKQNDHVPEPLNYCDFYAIWSEDVDAYLLNAK